MSLSQLEKDPAAGNAVIHVIVVGVDNSALTTLAARVSGDGVRATTGSGRDPREHRDADVFLVAGMDQLSRLPATDVGAVVLSDDVEAAARLAAARELPAWGVLPRGAASEDVRAALIAVARGLVVVPAAVAHAVRRPAAGDPDDAHQGDGLTRREHEVLELASQGLSNREIGAVLGISDHTVKFHLASVYGKLGVATRAEAVQRGLRSGILSL
jgi:two-component system nitrate/nitrite response regulator NarL